MSNKQTKEVTVPVEGTYLATYREDMTAIGDMLRESFGDGGIAPRELPRIRIPAAGGTAWEIPTLEGNEVAQEFPAVIVHWKTMRAYWDVPFEESGGEPPRCTSDDGIVGIGDPGTVCKNCKFNQFGTADSGNKPGKACREVRGLFVLDSDKVLPYFMPLPPMSIKPAQQFFMRLAQNAVPFWGVETRFGLEQDKNRTGIKYSKAHLSLSRVLNEQERVRIQEYREYLKPAIDGTTLTADDVRE